MNKLSEENWVSIKKVGLPDLYLCCKDGYSTTYESNLVLIQTKCNDMFIAECIYTKYENKRKDRIEWFSYGTGGRRMKVMSKVIAWMELPEWYEGE